MVFSQPAPFLDILILGGGPAGLSLGRELKQRGVRFLILEQGPTVGHSWERMPTHMNLLSPWKANWLPGGKTECFGCNQEISRANYGSWLKAYSHERSLPVVTNAVVHSVARASAGEFRAHTGQGEFRGRLLVNATGYFSNPYTPSIPGAAESAIPQRHTASYKDAATLQGLVNKRNPLVLIIGKRLSAGQTMVELVDAGCTVALSFRGNLRFGCGPLAWWLFFRIHPWLEDLKLKYSLPQASGIPIPMQGGATRRLIQSGRVRTFPEVAAFEGESVLFRNSERLQPDAVIYATGFRPALRHLSGLNLGLDEQTGLPETDEMESSTVPGLFFLGLDGVRNFQSRFIRGIRKDAAILACRLAQQLRAESPRKPNIEALVERS